MQPTMQFFKGGVKKAELVGADVIKLRSIMEHLYKWERLCHLFYFFFLLRCVKVMHQVITNKETKKKLC